MIEIGKRVETKRNETNNNAKFFLSIFTLRKEVMYNVAVVLIRL